MNEENSPRYPKKDEVAPRITPTHPNCGGISGLKFSFLVSIKPPTVMKITMPTFSIVKIVVTVLLSFTPFSKRNTDQNETTNAIGLNILSLADVVEESLSSSSPKNGFLPVSSINHRLFSSEKPRSSTNHSQTLSPHDLATAAAIVIV